MNDYLKLALKISNEINSYQRALAHNQEFINTLKAVLIAQQNIINAYAPVFQLAIKFNSALNALKLTYSEEIHNLISASLTVLQSPQINSSLEFIHALSSIPQDELLALYEDYLLHKSELSSNTQIIDVPDTELSELPSFFQELSKSELLNFLQFILTLIVTISIACVSHSDAERAHQDAIQSHQDAITAHQDAVNALKQSTPDAKTNKPISK